MKLANLYIDRFGARGQLSLREFSDDLNVIYGPDGEGKSTIGQFIRWMLFGQQDHASQPYLSTGETPSRGSMTILEGASTRSFQRTNRSRDINEVVDPDTFEPVSPPRVEVSIHEFDRFFNVRFDRPHKLADLMIAARTHDFPLDHHPRQQERIQQLTKQIDEHRDALDHLPFVDDTPESLRRRLDDKRYELDAMSRAGGCRREELQRRRQPLAAAVLDQHTLVERLNGIVERINAAIATRRDQINTAHQQWIASREEEADRRHGSLVELGGQIAGWHEMLDAVRTRLDHLRRQIASLRKGSDAIPDGADVRQFLRTLGLRFQNIQHDLPGVYDEDARRDHEADADYLRGVFGSALNSLQDDIARLYDSFERQQRALELNEYRDELKYLSCCESELSDLIEALNKRRDRLGREFSTDGNASSSKPAADPLDDFRLRHLFARREAATARQNEAKVEFADRQRELRAVEEELVHFAEDDGIADQQRELNGIDAMLQQADQRRALQQTIISLEDQVQRLRGELRKSEIVEEAATVFARLTAYEYTSIGVSESGRCHVTHRDGRVDDDTQLGPGARDQLYLSLCLAIVSAYRRRRIELPLILNDIFVNLNSVSTRALVNFLADFSRAGHQVLVVTSDERIGEAFQRLAVKSFKLGHTDIDQGAAPIAPTTAWAPRHTSATTYASTQAVPQSVVAEIPPPVSPEPTYRWAAEWHREPSPPVQPAPAPPAVPPPVEPPQRDDIEPPSGTGGLQLISPLSAVPTLDKELISCIHELGVERVDAFLELDPAFVEDQLGSSGITAEIMQRRQREILMMLYVAVTPLEAQLLVSCGVPDPERLGRADEAVLRRRVETLLQAPEAASLFGTVDQYSVRHIRGWIQTAQGSAYHGRAPRSVPRDAFASQSTPRATTKGPRRATMREPDSTKSKNSHARETVRLRPERELRFYLDPNDPVVDAPSIGPKTSERLHRVDIHVVGDLLQADPDDTAARLKERRITPATVLQWQLQAQLVCRIPNLRSHEAQILVACGVEDPAKLAALDAGSFLQQVTRFVETKEGQRILRNAKHPDLAEVAAWIQWSQNARQLKAA